VFRVGKAAKDRGKHRVLKSFGCKIQFITIVRKRRKVIQCLSSSSEDIAYQMFEQHWKANLRTRRGWYLLLKLFCFAEDVE